MSQSNEKKLFQALTEIALTVGFVYVAIKLFDYMTGGKISEKARRAKSGMSDLLKNATSYIGDLKDATLKSQLLKDILASAAKIGVTEVAEELGMSLNEFSSKLENNALVGHQVSQVKDVLHRKLEEILNSVKKVEPADLDKQITASLDGFKYELQTLAHRAGLM
jgi:hypothetical protein